MWLHVDTRQVNNLAFPNCLLAQVVVAADNWAQVYFVRLAPGTNSSTLELVHILKILKGVGIIQQTDCILPLQTKK